MSTAGGNGNGLPIAPGDRFEVALSGHSIEVTNVHTTGIVAYRATGEDKLAGRGQVNLTEALALVDRGYWRRLQS